MNTKNFLRQLGLFFIIFAASLNLLAQSITLHYNPRPPYLIVKDGVLNGLTGSPAVAAFKAAGVAYTLAETPASRQLFTLKTNDGLDCGVGWFKNPEREGFAKFTKPIYRDHSQLAVTASGTNRLQNGDRIDSILSNKDLVLLVKQGYSYGKELDGLIETYQPTRSSTTDENILMLKSIKLKMADYMFAAPEEALPAIAAAGFQQDQFNLIKPGNMPLGEFRYIICSKSVPDEIIKRLNSVIK